MEVNGLKDNTRKRREKGDKKIRRKQGHTGAEEQEGNTRRRE